MAWLLVYLPSRSEGKDYSGLFCILYGSYNSKSSRPYLNYNCLCHLFTSPAPILASVAYFLWSIYKTFGCTCHKFLLLFFLCLNAAGKIPFLVKTNSAYSMSAHEFVLYCFVFLVKKTLFFKLFEYSFLFKYSWYTVLY